MSMNIDAARQTFFEEARELLQQYEDILLAFENGGQDAESVNALFRAAHTIKGSAGLFGFDAVVAFTHVVESVLERLRGGALSVSADLTSLLLECGDQIGALVAAAAADAPPDEALAQRGRNLIERLGLHLYLPEQAAAADGVDVRPAAEEALAASGGGPLGGADTWHLSLRFGAQVLRLGMDPLAFIRYLGTLGDIVHLQTLDDTLPPLEEGDAEACYLAFEIDLKSAASRQEIEDVFEFVRDDAHIHLLPPRSAIADYVALINQLPEGVARLGEILVAGGALTAHELAQALAAQEQDQGGRRLGEIVSAQGDVPAPVVAAALDKQKRNEEKRALEARCVKVPADKLDLLIDLVGELVIAGAGTQLLASRSLNAVLAESASQVTRLVEEVRDAALRLRMVQIGEVFGRFPRVVRDLSRELGKDVALKVSGAETELDKSMVERLGDPLMHLMRNAMDHGLETAEERTACGKPAQGTLSLAARHESGSILIEVRDDGRGLDRARILAKARERGLVGESQSLQDGEIDQLILQPGFSTATQVTNLSGRGVGMDVVKSAIEAMRGTIEIENQPGAGTCMRLALPLTLAIIDGFLVGVGRAQFVLPLEMVTECIELPDGEEADRHEYLNLRGEVLPFLRLRELFEVPAPAPRRQNVVVVQHGGRQAGLVVDQLMGECQTVIKPLGLLFEKLRGISGSTILASGEVGLILDVTQLLGLAMQREAGRLDEGARPRAVLS